MMMQKVFKKTVQSATTISREAIPLKHANFGIWIKSTCSCHRKHEYYLLVFAACIMPEQLFYYYGSSDNDDIELI